MTTFEFRVRCANRGDACTFAKGLMRDFTYVNTVDKSHTYDHIGQINLEGPSLALKLKKELEQKSSGTIRSIEIAAL